MRKYIFSFFIVIVQFSYAVGVHAGTKIVHVAHLDYKIDSIKFSVNSNKLVDIVDQKLDTQMVCQESETLIVEPEDTKKVMHFMVVNNGNGKDNYELTPIEGDNVDFSVSNIKIYKDNDDGVFSESEDTLITKLTLAADESASLFFVADIPKDAKKMSANGIKVNSLIQGDLLYGEFKKVDKFYALVADTQENKSALCTYEVPSIVLELEKTATLSSDKLYKRTTIHYSIGVKAIGIGTVENIVVTDIIPEGTTYVKGSVKLDGTSVDGFDDDKIAVVIDEIKQEVETTEILHRVTFDAVVE